MIKGGDCYNPATDNLEFCIFDKIDGSVHPSQIKKCTSKEGLFFLHIPQNDKVPSLIGKFICLKLKYKTKD